MKKIITTIFVIAVLALTPMAMQAQNDRFFNTWEDVGNGLDNKSNVELPTLPGGHGHGGDVIAPIGGGLLILTALGAGYALQKKANINE